MAQIRPFRGVRPGPGLAGEVLAPPYDVLSEAEAREIFSRHPRSFLRVTRPEVNLPEGSDAHGVEAYRVARAALEEMMADGTLVRDAEDCLYLYGQRMGDHEQLGLLALCSVDEYDAGTIKKHEYTRPDKEQDRVDHIRTTGAHTGLVFLAYRQTGALEALMTRPDEAPLFNEVTDDGVRHTLWRVSGAARDALVAAFAEVPALYIADGHHRSAAASRIAAERGGPGPHRWFLAGIFPDDHLQVLAYNRLVVDLNGHTPEALRAAIGEHFEVAPSERSAPEARGQVQMYLEGRWWSLVRRPRLHSEDPVADLDVAVLQDKVLDPLLGITDPRRDTRISFVGGIRGAAALAAAVDRGEAAVAFSLYPTGLDELFRVADADRVMPPKSTWFEPKLRGGVVINVL
jgi:uncharacterized protein (DUF1015 family)